MPTPNVQTYYTTPGGVSAYRTAKRGSVAEAEYLLDVARQNLAIAQDTWRHEMTAYTYLANTPVVDGRKRWLLAQQRRYDMRAWRNVLAAEAMVTAAEARLAQVRAALGSVSDE